MSDAEKYYVTTPIYYVNDKPHIGHAYTTCNYLVWGGRKFGIQRLACAEPMIRSSAKCRYTAVVSRKCRARGNFCSPFAFRPYLFFFAFVY